MFCTRQELYSAIDRKDERIKNFFDTFGFVVIKNMLNASEYKNLKEEYDAQYRLRDASLADQSARRAFFSGGILDAILKFFGRRAPTPGMRFLPNFVDTSQYFTDFFFKEEMQKLYRYFAGEDFLYLGSDGSHFLTTSFPWHRDWYTKNPILKINYYFSDFPFLGGRFMLIPGSNFASDSYAALLQKSMSWPMQNKFPGGMNENSFLPISENPRQSYLAQKWQNLKNYFSRKSDNIKIPHVSVKLNRGDVVIFDQRLIHCVESNFPIVPRRLLTILLSKNAFEFSDDHYLIKSGHSRQELMREVVDLVVSERNHIKIDAYGPAIRNHPLVSSPHFIEISKITDANTHESERFNFGRFKCSDKIRQKFGIEEFSSRLDTRRYAEIGRKFRQETNDNDKDSADVYAESYSYEDAHLGINAQNIDRLSTK